MMSVVLLLSLPLTGRASSTPFVDLQGHWAQTVVEEICAQGLMQGMGHDEWGNRIFAPNQQLTRAQAAAALVTCFKLDYGAIRFVKQPLASDYYQDVDDQAWYAGLVLLCAINQIFAGSDLFFPERPISRLEMAKGVERSFAARGISIPMIMSLPVFKDIEGLSGPEINAIAFVNNTGIMNGADQYFRPGEPLTRAELAQILVNCLRVMKLATADEGQDIQQYRILSGQSFTIALDANPTTGYQWELEDSYNHSLIKIEKSYYQESQNSSPPRVGMGGKSCWDFVALAPGTTEIKLYYARPWESTQPLKSKIIKIVVASE